VTHFLSSFSKMVLGIVGVAEFNVNLRCIAFPRLSPSHSLRNGHREGVGSPVDVDSAFLPLLGYGVSRQSVRDGDHWTLLATA